jgi:hypothetical protein
LFALVNCYVSFRGETRHEIAHEEVSASLSVSGHASANLVLNPDFLLPLIDPQHAPDWRFTPAASGSDFSYGFMGGPPAATADIFSANFGALFGPLDTIDQVIPTVAGTAYTVSFELASNGNLTVGIPMPPGDFRRFLRASLLHYSKRAAPWLHARVLHHPGTVRSE